MENDRAGIGPRPRRLARLSIIATHSGRLCAWEWHDWRQRSSSRYFAPPHASLLVLIEVHSVSQVGISFEKVYLLNFVRMRPRVTQDEQSVAHVNDVDQPIPDNRVAPHNDLRLEVGIGGIRV